MTRITKFAMTTGTAACLLLGRVALADNPGGGTSGADRSGQQSGQSGQSDRANAQQDAGGQQSHEGMMKDLQKADSPDKLFLIGAAISNQKEIQWAQIAQQKSQTPQVKQLAQTMLQDHNQVAQQLQKLIEQQGLTMPQGMPPMARQEQKVLESLSGQQFDQHFLSDVKAGHAATISKFEDEAKVAQDPAIKQFASTTLTTLQQHSRMVQQAAVAAGLPSGAEAQPAGSRIPADGSGSGTGGGNTGTGTGTGGSNPGTADPNRR